MSVEPVDVLAELAANPSRLDVLGDEELADVLGELERLKARVWARLNRPPEASGNGNAPPETDDRLLAAEEVAEIMGVEVRYVYDHADAWPFTRRLSPRKLRFSERGLHRWLDTR